MTDYLAKATKPNSRKDDGQFQQSFCKAHRCFSDYLIFQMNWPLSIICLQHEHIFSKAVPLRWECFLFKNQNKEIKVFCKVYSSWLQANSSSLKESRFVSTLSFQICFSKQVWSSFFLIYCWLESKLGKPRLIANWQTKLTYAADIIDP